MNSISKAVDVEYFGQWKVFLTSHNLSAANVQNICHFLLLNIPL